MVGWNIQDTTRLWLEAGLPVNKDGALMSSPLAQSTYPELFEGRTLLVCAVIIEPPPNSSNSPVGKNKARYFPLGI
ncbi:MAG: hypothetical protein ACLRXB_14200 [Escherichia coli]